ncbi:hypothetical protein [Flavobacterium beibuense]|uniref:hypothetical protein n=1 Tax=Flavobacterium beibuense TaxID=657326 RepID=UPI003A8FCD03
MKKHEFTAEGIKSLQAGIHKLDAKSLHKESKLVAEDFLSWLTLRVELSVYQLEFFRQLDSLLRTIIGYHIAGAIALRQYFTFTGMEHLMGNHLQTLTVSATSQIIYYGVEGGLSAEGTLVIRLSN